MTHRPSPTLQHPARACALALCALLAAAPAWAGNVIARAGQNPARANDVNAGAVASASWGPNAQGGFAEAFTTRTAVEFDTRGWGGSASFHFNAVGSSRSDYVLWDLQNDQPLDEALADTLVIDFGYQLVGQMAVEAISLSSARVDWSASLTNGALTDNAGSGAQAVFGPMTGGPGYFFGGDSSLQGAFDQTFWLQHRFNSTGVMTMSVSGLSGNRAVSQARLALVSLQFAPSPTQMAPGADATSLLGVPTGVGIRFVETGQILAVSPVPEAATSLLWLTGGMVLLAVRRWPRQQQQRQR